MLSQYLPVLVFIVIGLVIGLVMLGAGSLLGKHNPDSAKNAPYECGFDVFESAHIPFDVRFYLVAILFIIFDLETAFFVPWALALRKIGWFGLTAMMIFLTLLVIGFIYEWKRGALEWE
ncbi:NADH dehydrogenase I subunit A [Legionella lansingensis]|uniref:NADH-quinone oxidoreductase subunit A n=1 Tax=Legionella lansingensis TaxID=45067 RepID=A0A0W0VR58_9GAMM|nr:NADH-quinone oxidoreductase subunit A [Legionella lansingensis]KTD22674.1 NADH dehydrogenase I chain A [Legionella lansingensis]SNV55685.1 NADH dehydrogenase I subunit A [Legionella lansingensis]